MSDIQEEQKRLYKRAEENDKENLKYMSIEEALNQIKQRIMMHELEQTTSNENEREKIILNYINKLQKQLDFMIDRNDEKQNIIDKAIEYIEYEMPCLWEVDEIFEDMDGKDYNTWKEYDENKLLNILKGDNK